MTPSWLLEVVAAFMLVVAGVSAARLAVGRPWRPDSVIIDADIAHLLMSIAMAGMLAPSLRTFPSAVWEVIFGGLIVVFGFRVIRDARANGVHALAGGHCAPHLVHSASMLYMFLAIAPVAGMAGTAGMAGMSDMSDMSGSMQMLRYPTLAFAFTLILIGYTIWDLDQLSGKRYSLTSTRMSLAGIRATPAAAMAGAESAAGFSGLSSETFSGLPPEGVAAGTASSVVGAADGQALSAGPDAAGPNATGGGSGGAGTNAAGGPVGRFLLSPAVTVGARIVMGGAMAFMLLILI
jgi:hypothetical protein